MEETTTASVVDFPTPAEEPSEFKPKYVPMYVIIKPNTIYFKIPTP